MLRAVAFTIVVLATAFLSSTGAFASGAIAYNPNTGAWGAAWNYSSQGAANATALSEPACQGGCQIVVQFTNACGALARGANNGAGWAWSSSLSYAENRALGACDGETYNCGIIDWACDGQGYTSSVSQSAGVGSKGGN